MYEVYAILLKTVKLFKHSAWQKRVKTNPFVTLNKSQSDMNLMLEGFSKN